MKKIILALVAATAFSTPALADRDDHGSNHRPGFGQSERRGFENNHHNNNDRYHYDHKSSDRQYRRESWLDGHAYALLDRWAIWNFDHKRDGRLNRYEYENSQRSFWAAADRNRDGRVSDREYHDFRNRYMNRDFNQGHANGWHNGWRW
jgi:hypothetical protein